MMTRVAGLFAVLVTIGTAAAGVAQARPTSCEFIRNEPTNAGVYMAAFNLLGNGVNLKMAGQILAATVAEQCPEYNDLVAWWDAHANV